MSNAHRCANCGCPTAEAFCPDCGQNNRNYQRALPPLLMELVREIFDVDSRLFRTLHLLLLRPGQLSLEFSRNRRARYLSPFRLYLFVSVAFFFVLTLTTDMDEPFEGVVVDVETPPDNTLSQTNIELVLSHVNEERQVKAREIIAGPENTIARTLLMQMADDLAREISLQEAQSESTGTNRSDNAWSVFVLGQLIDAIYEPREALQRLFDNLPIALFFMLPVFALLLSLLYAGSERYYMENLVFATHLHTFAFLVYGLMLLLPEHPVIEGLLLLILVTYHFTALKRYYAESYLRTFCKYSAQLLLYFLLLLPVVITLVALLTLATV